MFTRVKVPEVPEVPAQSVTTRIILQNIKTFMYNEHSELEHVVVVAGVVEDGGQEQEPNTMARVSHRLLDTCSEPPPTTDELPP